MLFGQYIKELRQKRGFSCQGFAKIMNRATSTIHNIETGISENPGFDVICDISDTLGVSMEELKKAYKRD